MGSTVNDQPGDRPRSRPWWRFWLIGYAVAAASVAIALLLREHALAQRALDATPLLLAAIGVAAWFGGVGPGLAAVVLATLAFDYYFIPPPDSWRLTQKDVPSLVVFTLSSLFFCWVSAARRRADEALQHAHDQMEATVVERTADLARANDHLRAEIIERTETERMLEQLAGRLISAQEDERSRIGRELHDHVSQRLGILAIKIDQLRMNRSTGAAIVPALDELRQQTSEITDDIHALSHRLHSSMLDHLGVVPALQRLVKECSQRYAIPITFTHAPLPALVPSDAALCLFRVAEESLTNVARHSQAASARVAVASDGAGIRMTIADVGVGFDPQILETKAGLGFVSMRERLRLVHGTLRVHAAPAQGTTIDVWVPSPRESS
jgi:two-component system, NarL family, sensor kinase